MSRYTWVLGVLAVMMLTGSGRTKSGPKPLPVTFEGANSNGTLCLSARHSDISTKINVRRKAGDKAAKWLAPCKGKLQEVKGVRTWLQPRKGAKVRWKDGAFPQGEACAGGCREIGKKARWRLKVGGKTHTLMKFERDVIRAETFSMVQGPKGRHVGVHASVVYGTSMCPSNLHEVLVVIDTKTGKLTRWYDKHIDHHSDAYLDPSD